MGFYVMTWGGSRYTSVAWFSDEVAANTLVQKLRDSGAWTGMPPKTEPDNTDWTKRYKVRCSRCEALVINGFPTHKQGCPNHPRTVEPEYPSDEWEPRQ